MFSIFIGSLVENVLNIHGSLVEVTENVSFCNLNYFSTIFEFTGLKLSEPNRSLSPFGPFRSDFYFVFCPSW